jgi:hypothetical protein
MEVGQKRGNVAMVEEEWSKESGGGGAATVCGRMAAGERK